MHEDSPVYFLSQSKSHRITFSQEDSWLLASLAGISVPKINQSVTRSILELMQGHSRFQFVKRVAVAERLGISNQLRTVCAATSSSIVNTMVPGYSCFVNPSGSIFSISQTNMRMFVRSSDVVESFIKRGMPAQRSIARIAAMGLESGICWGTHSDKTLRGLIFINGSGVKWQEMLPVDYAIFALLSQITQHLLLNSHETSVVYTHLMKGMESESVGKVFSPQTLVALTNWNLQNLVQSQISIQVEGDFPITLVNHAHLGQIIARLIACVTKLPDRLIIATHLSEGHLRFLLPTEIDRLLDWNDYRVVLVKSDAEKIGFSVTHENGFIVLEVPYDGPAICDYST